MDETDDRERDEYGPLTSKTKDFRAPQILTQSWARAMRQAMSRDQAPQPTRGMKLDEEIRASNRIARMGMGITYSFKPAQANTGGPMTINGVPIVGVDGMARTALAPADLKPGETYRLPLFKLWRCDYCRVFTEAVVMPSHCPSCNAFDTMERKPVRPTLQEALIADATAKYNALLQGDAQSDPGDEDDYPPGRPGTRQLAPVHEVMEHPSNCTCNVCIPL